MIGSIEGKVIHVGEKSIIINVHGVGYKLSVSGDTAAQAEVGKEVFFWTHMHVREDALDLYGFLEREELQFFELLIQVSGIGPKGALTILAVASVDILRKAITSGDTAYLTKISGIGKKTAEKIVLELRDKVGTLTEEQKEESLQGNLNMLDALEALKSLGYREHEAREALKKVEEGADMNTKIREALKVLGGR